MNTLALALFAQTVPPVDSSSTPSSNTALLYTIIGVLVVAVVLLVIKVAQKGPPAAATDDNFRHTVARSVLWAAIGGIVILGILSIVKTKDPTTILNLLLPVFGTWVGTLLAYYFGKENFESAAKNATELARELTNKLQSIGASTVMTRVEAIELPAPIKGVAPAAYNTVKIKALVDNMDRERLPLLDPTSGSVVGVVHKSLLNAFLVAQPTANQATVTLQDLLNDATYGKTAKTTFVTLPETATLADVKKEMANKSAQIGQTCQDVFIVASGTNRVVGWITDDKLTQYGKV